MSPKKPPLQPAHSPQKPPLNPSHSARKVVTPVDLHLPQHPQKKKHDDAQVKPSKVVQKDDPQAVVLESLGPIPLWADKKMLTRAVMFELDKMNQHRAELETPLPPLELQQFVKSFPGRAKAAADNVYEDTMPFKIRYSGLREIAQRTAPAGVTVSRWKNKLANIILSLNRKHRRDREPLVILKNFTKEYATSINRFKIMMEPLDLGGQEHIYQSWLSRKIKGWQRLDPKTKAKRLATLNNNEDPYRTRDGKEVPAGSQIYNQIRNNRMQRAIRAFQGIENIPREAYNIMGLPDPDVSLVTPPPSPAQPPPVADPPDEKREVPSAEELRMGSPTPQRPPSPTRAETDYTPVQAVELLVEEGFGTKDELMKEWRAEAESYHQETGVARTSPELIKAVIETIRNRHAFREPSVPSDDFADGDPAMTLLNASGSYVAPENTRPEIRPVRREGLSDPNDPRLQHFQHALGPKPVTMPEHTEEEGLNLGTPFSTPPRSDPVSEMIAANSSYSSVPGSFHPSQVSSQQGNWAGRPPSQWSGNSATRQQRPIRVVRPGRLRKRGRMTGGVDGWDVQRRPNFSIQEISAKSFVLVAREVNSGVYAQIKNLLGRVKTKYLIVDSRRLSKRQALDYIMPALRKGSVHVELP